MGELENLKKSIFSYIVWAVFALYCGLGIFSVLRAAGAARILGMPLPALVGCVFVCLYFMVTVFRAPRMISDESGIRRKKRAETILAIAPPVLVLLAAAAYLAFCLMNPPMPAAPGGGSFYRMALDFGGKGVSFTVHGASWLYTCLLHGVFLIFGDTLPAVLTLQIVLFFVCVLLLYVGVRAYTGAFPAAVSAAAFVFFPLSIEYVFSQTPGLFFLALYLSGFCLMGVLYRSFVRPDISALGQSSRLYLFSLFVGLYAGFLVYLDLGAISLFLFLGTLFSRGQKKKKQAFLASLAALAGGILGFFHAASVVVLSAGNLIEGGNFAEDIGVFWEQLTAFYAQRADFWVSDAPGAFGVFGSAPLASIALISLAFLNIPAFFAQRRSPASAFLLHLFLTNILFFSGATGLDRMELFGEQGHVMPVLGWCILAGLGVCGAVRMPDDETAGTDGSDEEAAQDGGLDEMRDEIREFDEMEAEDSGKKGTINKKKPAPGEPLHNPLPVPKKKSRARADFDHQVADSDMKFDVEVADDSDFDV